MNRFNSYNAKVEQTIDDIASNLRGLAAVIGNIRSYLRPKDMNLALMLMNSIDAPQYTMPNIFLEVKENLSFAMVIEKFKEVEQETRDNEGTGTGICTVEIANNASSVDSVFTVTRQDMMFG